MWLLIRGNIIDIFALWTNTQIFSHRTQQVTIINFALGKHLVREDDLLTDQRGSLAYVSPDVLSGKQDIE